MPALQPLAAVDKLMSALAPLGEPARIARGAWLASTLPRPEPGRTPNTVVHRQGKLQLRYYAPTGAERRRTPVVIVPSLINRAYICDLESDRSLVASLAGFGHPTYLVDWGEPTAEDAQNDVATMVLDLLHRAVDRACRHAGATRAHVLGYCQGGTLSAMYAALRPERVAGLVALAAPVRFREGGRFRQFADPSRCDVESLVGPDGLVGVDVMKPAFKLLDPVGAVTKYLAVEAAAKNPRELARVLVRERWLDENVPLPGAFATEFIRNAYQEDRLEAGTWELRGEKVRLGNLSAPLLVACCRKDFISPMEACVPLAELAGSTDVTTEVLDIGHIGVVVGGFGPKVFFPLLDRWFSARQP